jgi:putative phosphotransacetylase
MDILQVIQKEALCILAAQNIKFIPAAVSGRHLHLSLEHIEILFGKGYRLTELKPLSQPGQFACGETLEIRGEKGAIKNVRVLGPARFRTQAEISMTDSFTLGVKPVVRLSGDLYGTPGTTLVGPCGQVKLESGVIVALRHVHISDVQGEAYGLKDGDIICLKKDGTRQTVLENILVRRGEGHELELHVDMDEANAAMIANGDYLEIV